MSRQHGRLLVPFFAFLTTFAPAFAAGSIAGRVADRSGTPRSNAEITIRPKDDPKLRTYRTKTNAKGAYLVAAENGDYHIDVEAGDFVVDRLTIHAEDAKHKPVFDWTGRHTPGQPPIVIGMSSGYKINVDIVVVERAILRKERSDGLLAHIGKALEEGNHDRAGTLVDDFMKEAPGDATGLMLRGYLASEQGRLDAAEADLKAALEKQPEMSDARYQLGLVYRRLERREEALAAFLVVAEGTAEADLRGKAWLNVGELERAAGRPEKAIEAFQKAAEVVPALVPAVGPELAALYADQGNTESAEAWLERVESTGGTDPTVLFNLAVAHFNRKEWDAAIAGFRRVVGVDPKFAEAYRDMGFALQVKGDNAGALENLRKYLVLKPDASDVEDIKTVIKALGGA